MKVEVKQFYPQTDSATRHADRMCFSSTIAMFIKFLKPGALMGSNADDDYLKTVLKYGDTTNPQAHIRAVKDYGLEAFFTTKGTWADLEDALKAGHPVAVGWPHGGPVNAPTKGHWTLLTGLYDGKSRHHDPYGVANMVNGGYVRIGPYGKNVEYTIQNWKKRWMAGGQAWLMILTDPKAPSEAPSSPEKAPEPAPTPTCPTCGQKLPQSLPEGYDGSFKSVARISTELGAKWPRVAAAQWALESGYGKHLSGRHNFFGIKGKPGTQCETKEFLNGQWVTITDTFKDFDSPEACMDYLITRWYLDFKGYQGVNRANSEAECAKLLKAEGYATDPTYPDKLMRILRDNE